jgi:hypothetical protein
MDNMVSIPDVIVLSQLENPIYQTNPGDTW